MISSTRNPSRTRHKSPESPVRLTVHAGFGGRLSGKGPNYRDLAGQPTLQKRPLGIPVIADRAQQQRVRSALEPEWEARLDPKQCGFRPGRGCHDAIEMIHKAVAPKGAKRDWVLDAT
jgi:hypothetical protein